MFNEFLTTEGERLLAKSISGTATITFTKMELGDGDRGTASKNITSLESKKMTLDIYSVQMSGDNHVTITSILKSENIESGFYFREKAIYATDGTTEILFLYGTAGSLSEWVVNSKTSVFERTIRTIIAFSEGDDINVTIQSGAYASGADAKNILTAIENIKMDGDWAKYEQAESILSILDTFVAAYTTLRAGKLDNLDALISSRAPASTALSNATWTNARAAAIDTINTNTARLTATRAGLIDNLDAKISSRAPASTALSTATWTDARAGYLDNIVDSEHGLPVVAHYAYKSMLNTGSTTDTDGGINTGTVMAKLNALIDTVAKIKSMSGYYKPSNNLKYTFVSSEVSVNNPGKSLKLGGFYAAKNGCIRIVSSIRTANDSYCELSVLRRNTENLYSKANFYDVERGTAQLNLSGINNDNVSSLIKMVNSASYVTNDNTIWVEKGQYVAIYLSVTYENYTAYCNKLQVYFDEVE